MKKPVLLPQASIRFKKLDNSMSKIAAICLICFFIVGTLCCQKIGEEEKKMNVKSEEEIKRLHFAIYNGDFVVVQEIVEKFPEFLNTGNKFGLMPIHTAASYGKLEIVKYLVEKGADIEARDYQLGQTPLQISAAKGFLDVSKYLLEKGADPNAINNIGASILMSSHDSNISELLLKHGANIHYKTQFGQTALHVTAASDQIIKLLLENGSDPNQKDLAGMTPLHNAAMFPWPCDNRAKACSYLIKYGADVNARNMEDKTPLDLAMQLDEKMRCQKVIDMLIDNGGK